jgi:dTDP-glucose 4,6-dehydratase
MALVGKSEKSVKKVVYVTGCLGFIGIHVTQLMLDRGWYVIGVDKMTYASNRTWLSRFEACSNFTFLSCDINDLGPLRDCDYFINTAAETHVDNSIMASDVFIESNVRGVHHILELIRVIPAYKRPVLLHFSTDEVYGDIESGSHTEEHKLNPSNPYSASKAAADMLINAWGRTHGIPYVIVRPTNNYGIGQYVEKLIPKSVKYLELGRPIDLHDRGEPRRTWLHATDTARAVAAIIDAGVRNEIYNISGNTELPNRVVVQKILAEYFGNGEDFETTWLDYVIDSQRAGQDVRYSIDDSKLKSLGWLATAEFDTELSKVVQYYKDNFIW